MNVIKPVFKTLVINHHKVVVLHRDLNAIVSNEKKGENFFVVIQPNKQLAVFIDTPPVFGDNGWWYVDNYRGYGLKSAVYMSVNPDEYKDCIRQYTRQQLTRLDIPNAEAFNQQINKSLNVRLKVKYIYENIDAMGHSEFVVDKANATNMINQAFGNKVCIDIDETGTPYFIEIREEKPVYTKTQCAFLGDALHVGDDDNNILKVSKLVSAHNLGYMEMVFETLNSFYHVIFNDYKMYEYMLEQVGDRGILFKHME